MTLASDLKRQLNKRGMSFQSLADKWQGDAVAWNNRNQS
jgi:hypothetical protein